MPDSTSVFLSSLHKFARKFMHQLNILKKVKTWKRRKPKRLISDSSRLSSSFAAMEVSNQLKHVFQFIDANGDGKISPVELSQVLVSLGHKKSMAAKEAEGIVREMDCNGDGAIDLDEFMIVMGAENSEVVGGDREADLMGAFRVFDSDENGFISAEELQRVLTRLGCDKCGLRQCRRMIKGVDRDGDGLVDFEEFKSMMNKGSAR